MTDAGWMGAAAVSTAVAGTASLAACNGGAKCAAAAKGQAWWLCGACLVGFSLPSSALSGPYMVQMTKGEPFAAPGLGIQPAGNSARSISAISAR